MPFNDKVAIRVAGLYDGNRVNQVRNITRGGERGYNNTISGRFTLGLRPSEAFEAFLTYQYLNSDAKSFQQVVGAGNTPTRVKVEELR